MRAANCAATQELSNIMEAEGSLPYSQEPYTGPYSESNQSSRCRLTLSL
jgi:hypothetical protein